MTALELCDSDGSCYEGHKPRTESVVVKRNKTAGLEDQSRIWRSMSKALGADLREHKSIQGISGIEHPVQAIAADDKGRRLIVFSAEPNPRVAALMQVDVQAAMPGNRVLVARPIVFDLGHMSRQIFDIVGTSNFAMSDITAALQDLDLENKSKEEKDKFISQVNPYVAPIANVFENVSIPALSQIIDIIQQFSYLDWPKMLEEVSKNPANFMISINRLMNIDSLAIDRDHGVCPLPLYEFTEADWELFASGKHIDEVRGRLKELDIFQYFFPPPDQIALGAAEHGIRKSSDILATVSTAPELGHPLGDAELMPSVKNIPEILERLAEQGYVAEGEYGVTVTAKGRTERSNIKFRPREGLLVKLMGRFSAKVNLSLNPKDML